MAFDAEIKAKIYEYCNGHLPENSWYEQEFDFIKDIPLKKRLIEEFKGIRFAYKLYEGIQATDENFIFEVRHQIFSYATIYEATIHHLLYTYYSDTQAFHKMKYHDAPAKIGIPSHQLAKLNKFLNHNGDTIIPYHIQERQKDDTQIRFDDKCRTAEELGILHKFVGKDGEEVDIVREIIEIYSYRNAIHLVAELRKGVEYELELSKRAYRRMRPFIDQIKEKLRQDGKYPDDE